MSQKVALIASVLKPVDDTRLYEKLGKTIGQTTKYRVNIIGFVTKKLPVDSAVDFHPIFSFSRQSWGRLWAPWKFLILCFKLKPKLLIVSTPELLIPAAIYKRLKGILLWYDIQENYRNNIQYQSVYHPLLKPLWLFGLDLVEGLTESSIDHFISAERSYPAEINLPPEKTTVLENKYQPLSVDQPPQRDPEKTTFIYCGTLAPNYGLLESIHLIKQWHALGYPVGLTIIGVVRDPVFAKEIQAAVAHQSYIECIVEAVPVPHETIVKAIQNSHYGIVAHQPNASNVNCVPTRIYEFLALKIPFLLQQNPYWERVAAPYQAALTVDFQHLDAPKIWRQLQHTNFYTQVPGEEVLWGSQAKKLLQLLD